jgi:hypothetical protein
LNRKGLVGTDLPPNDSQTLQILESGLKSNRPEKVFYCLKLLKEAKFPK